MSEEKAEYDVENAGAVRWGLPEDWSPEYVLRSPIVTLSEDMPLTTMKKLIDETFGYEIQAVELHLSPYSNDCLSIQFRYKHGETRRFDESFTAGILRLIKTPWGIKELPKDEADEHKDD